MSVYFDFKVHISESCEVVAVEWHSQLPLLAVGVNIEESNSGTVYVCDELGEPFNDVTPPQIPSAPLTCLAWHPSRKILVGGWRSGGLRVWLGGSEWLSVASVHTAGVLSLRWSHLGTRLACLDQSGLLSIWSVLGSQTPCLLHKLSVPGEPTCLAFLNSAPAVELNDLARLAVAGDSKALDMFSAWRPRTGGQAPPRGISADATGLFVGTLAGNIYHVDGAGIHVDILTNESPVRDLLHHPTQPVLIVLTQGPVIGHYISDSDGALTEVTKVKLNEVRNETHLTWAGSSTLVFPTQEFRVRIWEIDSGDSYVLQGGEAGESTPKQWITSVSYSRDKKLLCGGSNLGNIVIWKRSASGWDEVATCSVSNHIRQSHFTHNNLAINAGRSVFILREHALCAHYSQEVCAVQTSAAQLSITSVAASTDKNSVPPTIELSTEFQVAGVALSKQNIVVWSGKMVAVYRLDIAETGLTISALGSFSCECERILIFEQSLLVLSLAGELTLHTLQGTIKQSLPSDSQVLCMDMNSHFVLVATASAFLYVWDLSRREAKLVTSPKDIPALIPDLGEVIQCRINCNATQVSLTVTYSNLLPSPTLYVCLLDVGITHTFSYTDEDKTASEETPRFITNHFWDSHEPNILVCEGRISQEQVDKHSATSGPSQIVLSCFHSSQEHGLLPLEPARAVGQPFLSLLTVEAPHYIFLSKPSQQKVHCEKLIMRDFDGIESCDDVTRSAVISFSYFLNTGNLDQAFKAIASITSSSVWQSLARMCVTRRRLDVARVCLGNMQDVRGLRTLALAEGEPETEARVAALALHLHLYAEAEELYVACKRYDLLNKLHQRRGLWEEAVTVAEKHDRINLKNTYHRYAKYLEQKGDIDHAVRMYEKADTHRQHVPRMLLENTEKLEKYISQSKDMVLLKWWAQYIESTEDMPLALKYYEEARDFLSMVRVLCFLQDFPRAAQLADSTGDKAAAYHLGRQYENCGQFDEAIHFYGVAGSVGNAVRLCKEQGLEDQLWTLALSAGPSDQIEAATYLEPIDPDKAVLLYHRAGALHKALDLAFKCGQLDAVESIAAELNPTSDVDLILKCAQYFSAQEHYDRAVHLFAIAKRYDQALTLIQTKHVRLSEELVDLLVPPESDDQKSAILGHLGNAAALQANYHLATRLFTLQGDKIKAMKCLLKSGDTEKIIFFANVSREREIYIMAANYLQTSDWKSSPELLKSIISFYTKGKAPHLLANFYVSCAQIEIDEYGNYEKGLGGLNEAKRCLSNHDESANAVLRLSVEEKIAELSKYLEMKRLFDKGEESNAMSLARSLLTSPLLLVRQGDVFSRMIEQGARTRDWGSTKALALELEKRLGPHENLTYYVPQELLTQLGIPTQETLSQNAVEKDDEIPEDITT